jgi:hypothetical protein
VRKHALAAIAVAAACLGAGCDQSPLQDRETQEMILRQLAVGSPPSAGRKPEYSEAFTTFGRTAAQTFSTPQDIALAHAACRGDLKVMSDLLAKGADPNAMSKDRSVSMLAWSMECQGLAGFEALLKAKADPNARLVRVGGSGAPYGLNMVTFAAGIALPDYLKLLLKYGGDPDSRQTDGNALSESLYLGSRDNYTNYYILFNNNANLNVRIAHGYTLSEHFCFRDAWDKVAELLDHGYHHRLDVLAWCLQQDAFLKSDPSQTTEDGRRQMQLAAKVKVMLEERGIKFPLRDRPDEQADIDAENARLAENAKKPGGLLLNP